MDQYRIRRGDTLSRIAAELDVALNDILAANPRLKSNPDRISVGDTLFIPTRHGEPSPALPQVEPATPVIEGQPVESQTRDWFAVPAGQLTFDAEGKENPNGRFHSRVPHVPGSSSGVTIGRGYDMKHRSREGIVSDLTAAGLGLPMARKFGRCFGFSGSAARQFLQDNDYEHLEITPESQYHLFLATYEELAGDVIRICNKLDVIDKYGSTDWDNLNPMIRDIVVDLRYRGDYTPATRTVVQPILVANNRTKMKNLMAKESYWRSTVNVPADRFKLRMQYAAA